MQLRIEVKELTLQRDLAQVQIKDILQEAGDNMSSLIGVVSYICMNDIIKIVIIHF